MNHCNQASVTLVLLHLTHILQVFPLSYFSLMDITYIHPHLRHPVASWEHPSLGRSQQKRRKLSLYCRSVTGHTIPRLPTLSPKFILYSESISLVVFLDSFSVHPATIYSLHSVMFFHSHRVSNSFQITVHHHLNYFTSLSCCCLNST